MPDAGIFSAYGVCSGCRPMAHVSVASGNCTAPLADAAINPVA
ncbi:hypothetical protein ACLB1Q_26570 [Escherichia coli]